ncbi:hypothetical protein ACFQEX_15180 [Roseibium salinum]|uniref:hypothetical protein n=1 Tax=Roseibium salinum TaxID=1604349 RepID=UPI0036064BC6
MQRARLIDPGQFGRERLFGRLLSFGRLCRFSLPFGFFRFGCGQLGFGLPLFGLRQSRQFWFSRRRRGLDRRVVPGALRRLPARFHCR